MYKKIAFFPINYETATFMRYVYMGGYEPIALLAPELNVLQGYDISKLDGGSNANIKLHTDYEEMIAKSDAVCLMNCANFERGIYLNLIEYANSKQKEIIMTNAVAKQLDLPNHEVSIEEKECWDEVSSDKRLKILQIDVPIISLFAIGEKCGQMQTELLARKYFLEKGYNVMQLGSNEIMELIGCLKIPDIMFDTTIDSFKRAIFFNRFIYQQVQLNKPDLILLGVPYPIMKYNNTNLNGLGIFPVIVQSAINSDIGIVNMHFADYTLEFLEEIKKFCKYRLNVETSYYGITNAIAFKNVEYSDRLDYLYLTSDFVDKNLPAGDEEAQFTIFPAYNEIEANKAFQKIENELQGNVLQI